MRMRIHGLHLGLLAVGAMLLMSGCGSTGSTTGEPADQSGPQRREEAMKNMPKGADAGGAKQ